MGPSHNVSIDLIQLAVTISTLDNYIMGRTLISERFFRIFCIIFSIPLFLAALAFIVIFFLSLSIHRPLSECLPILVGGLVFLFVPVGFLMRGLNVFEIHEHSVELGKSGGLGSLIFGIYVLSLGVVFLLGSAYSFLSFSEGLDDSKYVQFRIADVNQSKTWSRNAIYHYNISIEVPNASGQPQVVKIPRFSSDDSSIRSGQVRDFIKEGPSYILAGEKAATDWKFAYVSAVFGLAFFGFGLRTTKSQYLDWKREIYRQ